jgi:hypothetical protein
MWDPVISVVVVDYMMARRLLRRIGQDDTTLHQAAELQEKRNALHCRIQKWREVQELYMPGVVGLLAMNDTEDPIQPETTPLYLPSAMPPHVIVSAGLTEIETKLRLAQADDALGELRRLLRILRGLLDYKYTQLGPSQRAGTRARSMVSRFKEKIDRCAEQYQAAWNALTKLNPEGTWSQRYQRLTSAHIKTLGRGVDDESEGRREVSWIWMMRPECRLEDVASEEEMDESMTKFSS